MISSGPDFLLTPEKKRSYNRVLFDSIAAEYDRVTPLLSFWNDRGWKRQLVDALTPVSRPTVVDIACGTGDIMDLLLKKYPNGRIIGADLSPRMLAKARARLPKTPNIDFARADMTNLPFRDNSVDSITGGYALRNAPDLAACFCEIFRVLKPGGMASFLDFSHPPRSAFTTIQFYLLLLWGSLFGWLLHRKGAVYGYIAESLKAFPDRDSLGKIIRDCGFLHPTTRLFFAGTIAIVTFCKPPAD